MTTQMVHPSFFSFNRASVSNLSQAGVYGTLPKALTNQNIVTASRIEDPAVAVQKRALTQAKSVSELAQIKGLSDFPIPDNIQRLLSKKDKQDSDK